VLWSPPQEYLAQVFLPAIAQMGVGAELECTRAGFYPRGGGRIEARVAPLRGALRPLAWTERGRLRSLTAFSVVERRLPDHIVGRQVDGAREALGSAGLQVQTARPACASPGTMLMIAVGFERGRAGFTAMGERGKPAEEVGREAGEKAAAFLAGEATVDPHLADQLLIYAALAAGETSYVTSQVTEHLRTNAWVIRQLLDVEIEMDEASGRARVRGAGLPVATGKHRAR